MTVHSLARELRDRAFSKELGVFTGNLMILYTQNSVRGPQVTWRGNRHLLDNTDTPKETHGHHWKILNTIQTFSERVAEIHFVSLQGAHKQGKKGQCSIGKFKFLEWANQLQIIGHLYFLGGIQVVWIQLFTWVLHLTLKTDALWAGGGWTVDLQPKIFFQHKLLYDIQTPVSSKAPERHFCLHDWKAVLSLLALLTPLVTAMDAHGDTTSSMNLGY